MASYAVVASNDVAMSGDTVLAVVVTDGEQTIVLPTEDPLGLADIDWPTGDPEDVLRAGLANLYYFTVDGPHTFEGTAAEAAAPIAASYGVG